MNVLGSLAGVTHLLVLAAATGFLWGRRIDIAELIGGKESNDGDTIKPRKFALVNGRSG